MSFESPKKSSEARPSVSLLDDATLQRTPIKDKFKSIISKASHRSSTTSFNSFNSKRKSFEVLSARDSVAVPPSNKPLNLTIETSPESDKKRESASTYSETSTEFNNTSPLPPASMMDADDDYEYYRYYYNYHQQQHQGTTSHIIENLESSGSSKDDAANMSDNAFRMLPSDPLEFRKRNIIEEPISEEATKSSIVLSPPEPKLDILSISSAESGPKKLSEEEEIERQKNEDEQLFKKPARAPPVMAKRKSHPPSSTSVNTFTTNESFHSAVSDLDDASSVPATESGPVPDHSSGGLAVPVNSDPRFSTNSRNTLKNIYSAYLNEPASEGDRSSSIYENRRASTLGSTSNRNTATPSLLNVMATEMNSNPLPDINKYSHLASTSTLSLHEGHARSKSSSSSSQHSVAHVSGASLYSSHSRSRSVSSGLSSKRHSRVSENAVGGNRMSQGFYFESEEPVQAPDRKRLSNVYSKAQTRFPLLSGPPRSSPGAVGPPRSFRDTVTTTNTYASSNYQSRASYQTNLTSPTETFRPHGSKDYSYGRVSEDQRLQFENYDKRLQELQSNFNEAGDADADEEIDIGEDEDDKLKHESNDNESIFVPPYLNNTAHTQSSSFSSLRKNGQESFKSSKSNSNLNAATLAAATEAAIAANQAAVLRNLSPHSSSSRNEVPNLLTDEKKLFIRPISYNKDLTIRSTTNSGLVRPSAGFRHSHSTPRTDKFHSATSPTTPFSPLSIQDEKYIKSINSEPKSKGRLKPFNLRPAPDTAGLSNIDDIENMKYNYNADPTEGARTCSSNTAILLLVIGIFVPPVYLVMCFGFLDPSVGYIPRHYKLIAAALSMLVTVLSIVGICVGFGVGLS